VDSALLSYSTERHPLPYVGKADKQLTGDDALKKSFKWADGSVAHMLSMLKLP